MDNDLGAVILFMVGLCLLPYLIALAVALILLGAPICGLGWHLKHRLTERYRLSSSKKWQCLAIGLTAFALPFLSVVVVPAPTPDVWLGAAWVGLLGGMSCTAAFLSLVAYGQHFAAHRSEIERASAQWRDHNRRQVAAGRRLRVLERTIETVESKYGGVLAERLARQKGMVELMERSDPSLCRIEMEHWERLYGSLTAQDLEQELKKAKGQLAGRLDPQGGLASLRVQLIQCKLLDKRLAQEGAALRLDQMKAERDHLRVAYSAQATATSRCWEKRKAERETIALLKKQRLHLR